MSRLVLILAAMLLVATPASAARPEQLPVRVPLMAGPATDADMTERPVAIGEPFLIQRLTAVKSATLGADAVIKLRFNTARLAKGTRLFLAKGRAGETFYCGAYEQGMPEWAGGNYKVQWVCLQDADGDQVFERAWGTPNNAGSYLPAFAYVIGGPAVSLAYTVDAEDARLYWETAIVHEDSFNIYGSLFFYQKVRRQGETRWSNVASITKGVQGGYVTIPGARLPTEVTLAGARFMVLAKSGKGVTVRPLEVDVGERAMGLFSQGPVH
jgi:hypothetical protein